MSDTPADRSRIVFDLARDQGFARVGIAPAEHSQYDDAFLDWLEAGTHGEMHYMAEHVAKRLDPRELLPGAASVICVLDRYPVVHPDMTDESDPPRGRVARYAWGEDYHRHVKKRLFAVVDALQTRWPDHEFKTCVDTVPTLEREHAMRAGLGWIGKHTLLIHPKLGSWALLGEIVTTLPLATSEALDELDTQPGTSHCGTCTRCIDACPTHCIEPYKLDATRCISYLTLEHRSAIDPSLHDAMGDWIAGCDVCQEVCPYNNPEHEARQADEPPPHARYAPRVPPSLPLLELLGWSKEDRTRVFSGSALKRIKLDMLKRNVLIAAGNALRKKDNPALRERIKAMANDLAESDMVRETARTVSERLANTSLIGERHGSKEEGSDERSGEAKSANG